MKTCTKCGVTKDESLFCKNSRSKSGLASHCKECRRSYYTPRPWPTYGPDDLKTCSKCKIAKPTGEFDRRGERYYSQCKSCRRLASLRWKQRNSEHLKQYRRDNRERLRAGVKKWEDENRERHLEIKRKLNRREEYKAYYRLRANVRHRAVGSGDFTRDDFFRLVESQQSCKYCGVAFSEKTPPTIDHVIPLSKGGTHTKDNIVLACKSCNSKKGNR